MGTWCSRRRAETFGSISPGLIRSWAGCTKRFRQNLIKGKRRVSFKVSSYDRTRPLVIDRFLAIPHTFLTATRSSRTSRWILWVMLRDWERHHKHVRTPSGSLDLGQGDYSVFVTKLKPTWDCGRLSC